MKLIELLADAPEVDFNGLENKEIVGVTGDSRKVGEGFAFLCISGTKADGHNYIGQAAQAGAVVAIVEYIPDGCPIDCVVVKNTRLAASYIFSNWYGRPQDAMKMIGVTGTNGKTSTTFMLRSIYEHAGYNVGVIGTILNSWMGKEVDAGMTTPDPERLYGILNQMKEDGVEYVFMEVSSHSLALGRVAPIHFEAGIYTNLTPEHLDFHKTMDEYAAAKEILFKQCNFGVFSADNSYVKEAAEKKLCESYTFSGEGSADYTADHIEYNSMKGIRYTLSGRNGTIMDVNCPIAGKFTVYNTMGAIVCALLMGMDVRTVKEAIAEMSGVPGRIERVTPDDIPFTVVVDYAHTPDALENVITSILHSRKEGQKLTVIFGCGGDRDKTKRPVMGRIATEMADFTIITSDNCRTEDPDAIIAEILEGVDKSKAYMTITDRREAIAYGVANAQEGEIILIAGKGHENYEIKKDGKHPFSEREEVAKALAKRYS